MVCLVQSGLGFGYSMFFRPSEKGKSIYLLSFFLFLSLSLIKVQGKSLYILEAFSIKVSINIYCITYGDSRSEETSSIEMANVFGKYFKEVAEGSLLLCAAYQPA